MTDSVGRHQFVALMTGLRNFGLRRGDGPLAVACDACVSRVSSAAADCPIGTFFAQAKVDQERWEAPPAAAGRLPGLPKTPTGDDGVTALNFVHKGLCDKALMVGDSKYLAALRACRWHRNTSEACPMYREYLRGASERAAARPVAGSRQESR
jgi:hypothetical protein